MRKHSKYSPSASSRWMACPGSIALCEKAPPEAPSKYAEEGTLAHEVAEECINDWTDSLTVNPEMDEAVQVYLDEIRSRVTEEEIEAKSKTMMVEKKFSLEWLVPECFGSNDCCIYDVAKKHLTIADYKHGVGVTVDVEWNSQLLMYALGAMHSVWNSQTEKTKKVISILDMVETVELLVVQPRSISGDTIKTWNISAKEVLFWGYNVLQAAALNTQLENAALNPGDHCKFCRANAMCPAMLKHTMQVTKMDFDKGTMPPDPDMLNIDQIANIINASDIVTNWIKQVKAFAQNHMEGGGNIPGHKLVHKMTRRKWKDEDVAADFLEKQFGTAFTGMYSKTLLSVTQMEKLLTANGLSKEACLQGLWEKPQGGLTMAPDSDRRAAVEGSIKQDFIGGN